MSVSRWKRGDWNPAYGDHGIDIRTQPLTTAQTALFTQLSQPSYSVSPRPWWIQESRANTSILPKMYYPTLSINYVKFRMSKAKSTKGNIFKILNVYNPSNSFNQWSKKEWESVKGRFILDFIPVEHYERTKKSLKKLAFAIRHD